MRDLKSALITAGYNSEEVYFHRVNSELIDQMQERKRAGRDSMQANRADQNDQQQRYSPNVRFYRQPHDTSQEREGLDSHRIASRARAPDRKAS